MTAHLEPALRRTALTFAARLDDIKDSYVGRNDVVDIVALAVLCREHALLVGPPGTAKTAVLERFCAVLRARQFSYLLTRFTEPAEVFGAIDVARFQREGVYRVNTEGMLPDVDIAFLDEIFHGSSAILNTLLTLVNERVFHNGSTREAANLITLLGASNDIPDDPVLHAFCDRFLFRCTLDYVPDDKIGEVLEVGWAAERAAVRAEHGAAGVTGFDLDDLRALQRATAEVDLSGIRDDLTKILLAFRQEAVAFSTGAR
ncbi:AAA family ATPase [Saccharothrix sp. MB29]|nr:AAA family ATPase [Saccharothrix sp. MB29]